MTNKNRLSEVDLDNVSGGMQGDQVSGEKTAYVVANGNSESCRCPECGKISTYTIISGGRRKCDNCGRVYEVSFSAAKKTAAYEA